MQGCDWLLKLSVVVCKKTLLSCDAGTEAFDDHSGIIKFQSKGGQAQPPSRASAN